MKSVSIGIPAYNEGLNVLNLIKQIQTQVWDRFQLVEIIVIDDGSTDNTIAALKELDDARVTVISDGVNKGKVERLNQLLKAFKTDILIQLDADIKLNSQTALDDLCGPLSDESVGISMGDHQPLPPVTFVGKAGVYGVTLWRKMLLQIGERALGHRCSGQIRAMSRKFAQEFYCPPTAGSIEDVYSFFYAVSSGYKPVFVPSVSTYFRVPGTFFDYTKQLGRFISSPSKLTDFFERDLLEKYWNISAQDKLRVIVSEVFSKNIVMLFAYAFLSFSARLYVKVIPTKDVWDVSVGSKNLDV